MHTCRDLMMLKKARTHSHLYFSLPNLLMNVRRQWRVVWCALLRVLQLTGSASGTWGRRSEGSHTLTDHHSQALDIWDLHGGANGLEVWKRNVCYFERETSENGSWFLFIPLGRWFKILACGEKLSKVFKGVCWEQGVCWEFQLI